MRLQRKLRLQVLPAKPGEVFERDRELFGIEFLGKIESAEHPQIRNPCLVGQAAKRRQLLVIVPAGRNAERTAENANPPFPGQTLQLRALLRFLKHLRQIDRTVDRTKLQHPEIILVSQCNRFAQRTLRAPERRKSPLEITHFRFSFPPDKTSKN